MLLCQGGKDPVAPAEWARVAAEKLREQRAARAGAENLEGKSLAEKAEAAGRVELLICEDRGHDLAPDDVWRARWWLRSRLEKALANKNNSVQGI